MNEESILLVEKIKRIVSEKYLPMLEESKVARDFCYKKGRYDLAKRYSDEQQFWKGILKDCESPNAVELMENRAGQISEAIERYANLSKECKSFLKGLMNKR